MSGWGAAPGGGAVVLRAQGIVKRFGRTVAVDGVSLELRAGEVHALVGENGAGKSTQGRVLAGLVRQDEGWVEVDGRRVRAGSIRGAFEAGVRIVHQELAQCPNLSVAENLCLHAPPRRGAWFDRGAAVRNAERVVHALDPGIDVRRRLGSLGPGHRQICQIAAALDEGGSGARVIVFDEPTSSLSLGETNRLLALVRELAGRGLSLVFVSHRMSEVFACCDRVTVLRDGRWVATGAVSGVTEAEVVERMLGRRAGEKGAGRSEAEALRALAGEERREPGRVVLRVSEVSSPGRLGGVSLEVRAGEIVGLAGLVGSGRSALLDAVFGVDARRTGRVEVDGGEIAPGRVRAAIRAGVGYVPEDRRGQGLFFNLGVGENVLVPMMGELAGPLGVRRLGREREAVRERTATLGVRTPGVWALPGDLSGGNQQKLLIARWVRASTRVLLLDEPTRGIDVGTKTEIHRLIRRVAAGGAAVVLVSSEMPELIALSDRVVVMGGGRVLGELSGEGATETAVLTLATREFARSDG